ncbi:MAG: ComF family protein [Candidatus Abawacabacteria bacterium]|nr:ComF family protein [Candidatus Abawacabacteria bacterium]
MSVWDLVFPPRCVHCNKVSHWLCESCQQYFNKHFHTQVHAVILPSLNQVFISCYDYSHTISRLLYAWKYRRWYGAGEYLKKLILAAYSEAFGTTERTLCVPVPIHRQRLRDRGFDQTKELLDMLVEQSPDICQQLLIRTKNTRTQVGLNRVARQQNVKRAFMPNITNKFLHQCDYRIVLIDDILTTGSTLQECAALLRQIGFSHIDALVLQRGT